MRPSSSGIVLVRTTAPSIPRSLWINHEYTVFPISKLTRKLIGTIVEKSTKNLIILTYHTLLMVDSKPSSATNTIDNDRVKAQRILVRELISYSRRPIFD